MVTVLPLARGVVRIRAAHAGSLSGGLAGSDRVRAAHGRSFTGGGGWVGRGYEACEVALLALAVRIGVDTSRAWWQVLPWAGGRI